MKKQVFAMILCIIGGVVFVSAPAGAFPSVTKIGDTVVDSEAMTLTTGTYGYSINGLSFQQCSLMTFNGWQYAIYYNGAGHVCIGRRNLAGGSGLEVSTSGTVLQTMIAMVWPNPEWDILELTDYTISTTGDAHNVCVMGICPNDGTIHVSFDHHGSALHYRVSQTGVATNPKSVTWDESLFGGVQSYLVSGTNIYYFTYPRFWQTPSGDLQLGYRYGGSGDGDWYIADYSGTTHAWSNVHEIISRDGYYSDSVGGSSSRNAYMNPPGYSPDGKLHLTWTWRESAGGANHDLVYAYSSDNGNTWYNNSGSLLGNKSSGDLISISDDESSPGMTVVDLDRAYGTMNQQSQCIDSAGRVHSIMFHCNSTVSNTWGAIGNRRYYHYWRDTNGTWNQNVLEYSSSNVSSYVGQRPKIFVDDDGNAYAIYQTWQSASTSSTALYVHNGDLVIQAATEANGWNDWQIIHVETGPFLSEAIGDPYRFEDGILSVVMQDSPSYNGQSTALRVLDFKLGDED